MTERKLLHGEIVESLPSPVDLSIHTKCPRKWMLIDLETGQQYRGLNEPGQYGKWERVKDATFKE